MVIYACNPRVWEIEAGGLQLQAQPGQFTYLARPCLKNVSDVAQCNVPKFIADKLPHYHHQKKVKTFDQKSHCY